MFRAPGLPHPSYGILFDALSAMSPDEVAERCATRDRTFRDQGITFSLSGEERPFPLDLIPRIVDEDDWALIEAGVTQRVRALEAYLADIYGAARILNDEVVPRPLVTSSVHFHRAATGIEPANGVRIHVAGIDIVRDGEGNYRVLEDNLRTPSGISYVVENRRTMARVFPELFASHRVRPVYSYASRLLEALRKAAPGDPAGGEPTVVVLTPGVHNAAYFEHSFLARQMGVELVEGRDLVCRGNRVFMRTTSGDQLVDVVYRRVDDDFLDPVHFRPDSLVGCPGILNAARAGNVTIANAVGNGAADDKLIYTYVPSMIRYYLCEEPILSNVRTWRMHIPAECEEALETLDQLVLKPVDASGGYGIVVGPLASASELAAARDTVLRDPRGWVAQDVVALSTSPTLVGDHFQARHVDLRPFAVNDGDHVWVVPGGLTRVALKDGSLVVNSSQGGGSKDTWVLAAEGAPAPSPLSGADRPPPNRADVLLSRPPPETGPGVAMAAQAQQQQQQQRHRKVAASC